ncbi:hypothetical protein HYPDE_36273 [Hyphomicrobium denitrificans 1NES1]|uniref:Uncharacterized protein n=1 Tax=Hyphomicrobium denitrificans 1NES1 TaxID=670307 RepID=N0BEJ7_9HYPH|nr:DUF6111 family protein [Hyphomicrobium denitrificans]AGK58926.1 hypothetical protein HYPDE_36273 [Hyphomicrobium denitrificans 1NES1]
MIRIVIENVFFFLLPTLFYIAWVAFRDDEWSGLAGIIREAPLLRLFIAGAALMLTTLIAFSSRTYNAPHDVYVPQSMQDGKLEPGRTIRATEPEPEKP